MVRFSRGSLDLDWVGFWIRAFQERNRIGMCFWQAQGRDHCSYRGFSVPTSPSEPWSLDTVLNSCMALGHCPEPTMTWNTLRLAVTTWLHVFTVVFSLCCRASRPGKVANVNEVPLVLRSAIWSELHRDILALSTQLYLGRGLCLCLDCTGGNTQLGWSGRVSLGLFLYFLHVMITLVWKLPDVVTSVFSGVLGVCL